MTTGRINQVTRHGKNKRLTRQKAPPKGGQTPGVTSKFHAERGPPTKQWALGPPNNQQLSKPSDERQVPTNNKGVSRSESGDHNDAIRSKLTGGYDPWLHVSTLGHLPRWTKHHPKGQNFPHPTLKTRGELERAKSDLTGENAEFKFLLYLPIEEQRRASKNSPAVAHQRPHNLNSILPSPRLLFPSHTLASMKYQITKKPVTS